MIEKWSYIYLAIAGLVVYINYILIRIKITEVHEKYVFPGYRAKDFTKNTFLPQCCNPLLCSLEGYWELKSDVGFKELSYVQDSNMQLRMRKGWPSSLYHGDLRCGRKYPLPRVVRYNKTELYYLDIISQCDSSSNAPCCRDDIGWCGRGEWFCKCERCLNYERMIHAELSQWKSSNKCNASKISQNDTCMYLQNEFSSVTFIGDSLVRHTFSALLIHLTNDEKHGALKCFLREKDLNFCSGENQFVDSSCHVKLATTWKDINLSPGYCSASTKKPKLSFVQAFSASHAELALNVVTEALKETRPLIIVGIGIHNNFNASEVIHTFLDPILNIRSKNKNSNPLVIWFNTHAAGPLKPMGFQETQGNHCILPYNRILLDYCIKHSVLVFDTFNITEGVHSFDGTHYGSALNNLKIDLLINALKALNI